MSVWFGLSNVGQLLEQIALGQMVVDSGTQALVQAASPDIAFARLEIRTLAGKIEVTAPEIEISSYQDGEDLVWVAEMVNETGSYRAENTRLPLAIHELIGQCLAVVR
jgi:hypothetical protein